LDEWDAFVVYRPLDIQGRMEAADGADRAINAVYRREREPAGTRSDSFRRDDEGRFRRKRRRQIRTHSRYSFAFDEVRSDAPSLV
jgi:hypothetical protein